MSAFLDALAERVLLADGAMGTQVQARDLDTEGLEGPQIGEALRKARIRAIGDASDPAG